MKITGSASLLMIASTLAFLSGCGAPPQVGLPPANRSALTRRVDHHQSWMAPEASGEDLLYVSDFYGVHVFAYPKGTHVGDLTGFASPQGLCSDRAGDVFVTDESARHVYEYAHGGTSPIEVLYDNYVDFNPIDCSVDPTTGNVAVASADATFVVIFPRAKNMPQVLYDAFASMYRCSYDDKGNLFVDHVRRLGKNYIGVLPKGSSSFTNYLLDRHIFSPGGIQFDGKHVAILDQGSQKVYQLHFAVSKATIIGTTTLSGAKYVYQYWIQGGRRLIGPDVNGNVEFWSYPVGGSPVKVLQGFTLPFGSTISVSA